MKQSLRMTALTLASVLIAMAQRPMRPAIWLDPDKSEPAGTHYHTFQSKLAGGQVSYLVYLPSTYESEPAQRYASVYWLHGLNGDQRAGVAFVEQLAAATRAGKAPAMIVVLVNGMRDSFYCDSKDGKWPIESVIVKELIPHIDQTYRTIARREMRAVEGYSMGGYGAAHLGFKYPELFGVVGIMAGALVTPSDTVVPPYLRRCSARTRLTCRPTILSSWYARTPRPSAAGPPFGLPSAIRIICRFAIAPSTICLGN
jgi:enterochelin esterase-like enzyme